MCWTSDRVYLGGLCDEDVRARVYPRSVLDRDLTKSEPGAKDQHRQEEDEKFQPSCFHEDTRFSSRSYLGSTHQNIQQDIQLFPENGFHQFGPSGVLIRRCRSRLEARGS